MIRKCQSCGEVFVILTCPVCRSTVDDRCLDCHNELVHKTQPNLKPPVSKAGGDSRHQSDEQYHGGNSRENR